MANAEENQTVIISALIIFILCFTFAGCSRENAEAVDNIQKITAQPKSDFETIKTEVKEVFNEVQSLGIIVAFQEVEICPEISGKVKNIYCNVGDEVKQGDLLAELDGESRRIVLRKRQAQLQKAEARFKKVQRDSEKAEELFKNRVISDSAYDDALLSGEMSEADLALARAEVMAAEKQLRDTKIRAPFAGRVAAREAEIGSIVAPAQTLFTFVSISKVKVALNLSEFDAAKISKGSWAAVCIDSLPENVFPGAVQTIGLKADDSTRTFPVEIVISNSEENILPGMVARVTVISQESRRVVVVPRKAVTTAGGKSVVSFLKGGKIEQKNVVTSPLFNDRVVVEKGLREGEELVVATNSL